MFRLDWAKGSRTEIGSLAVIALQPESTVPSATPNTSESCTVEYVTTFPAHLLVHDGPPCGEVAHRAKQLPAAKLAQACMSLVSLVSLAMPPGPRSSRESAACSKLSVFMIMVPSWKPSKWWAEISSWPEAPPSSQNGILQRGRLESALDSYHSYMGLTYSEGTPFLQETLKSTALHEKHN